MSQLEVDVAEWLINNKEGLQQDIADKHISHYHLFPDALYDIYDDLYANGALDLLKKKVMLSFNINPEEIELFFDKDYVKMTLGLEILKPPRS